ncbi:MAG: pyruvate kinase [Candidatus Ranarchaeia archaeon]
MGKKKRQKFLGSKIVCTIGPASSSPEIMQKLDAAGMDVARINFSHGTPQDHRTLVDRIRKHTTASILFDISGPKIRVGKLEHPIFLEAGQTLRITTAPIEGTSEIIPIDYPPLFRAIKKGNRIFINDGIVELKVTGKESQEILTKVSSGGAITSNKGVNIPGLQLRIPLPTEKDIQDIALGVGCQADWFAMSFIRNAKDVIAVKKHITDLGEDTPLISKIEQKLAVENFSEILEASDGIMVARGDLGIETPPEEVPILQKHIIRRCNKVGKPVIVATQMLESMTEHPRPTRAEANDVANAILDGADATMLSAETAIGKYPVRTVKFMKRIALVTVGEMSTNITPHDEIIDKHSFGEVIGEMVASTAGKIKPGAIIILTRTGYSARMIAKWRVPVQILSGAKNECVLRRLRLLWGVKPIKVQWSENRDICLVRLVKKAVNEGYLMASDKVISVSGSVLERPGTTNSIGIHNVSVLLSL